MSVRSPLFVATILWLATGVPARGDSTTTYAIQGTHERFGTFTGALVIEESPAEIRVQRRVEYREHQAYGLKIEEIWQGKGRDSQGNLEFDFALQRADYITEIPGVLKRSPEEFREPLRVHIALSNGRSEFHVGEDLVIEEYAPSANTETWWTSERRKIPGFGTEAPLLVRLARNLIVDKVIRWYRELPGVRQYEKSEDFRAETPYFFTDLTDLNSYRSRPGTLRVVQRNLDAISELEAYQRYLAFAPTLAQKERRYAESTKLYVNELGILSRAQLNPDGSIARHITEGDASLWSGMYAGTLAMKYFVTRDQSLLEEFRKLLGGLVVLMEAPGRDREFARQALRLEPGERPEAPWHMGIGPYFDVKYLAVGNNDMYKGLIFTLAWGQTLLDKAGSEIPPQLRDEMAGVIRRKSQDLLKLDLLKKRRFTRAQAHGLAAWTSGDESLRRKYISNYRSWNYPERLLAIDGGFYFGGITDWSGINLSTVSEISGVLISEGLLRRFPADWGESPKGSQNYPRSCQDVLTEQREAIRRMWRTNAMAQRDFLTVAMAAFAPADSKTELEFKKRVKKPPADEIRTYGDLWKWSRERWIGSLITFPERRGEFDFSWDHSLNPSFVMSPWPRTPWKSVKVRQQPEDHYQSLHSFPAYEGSTFGSSWYWKDSAFTYRGGASRGDSISGADYLFLYWLARYAGWLDGSE